MPPRVALYGHNVEVAYREPLREVIRYFISRGYPFVDADTFLQPSTEKAAFLSFDDSFASLYDALYILEEEGVRATFYLNTCCFRDVASRSEIEAYFRRIRHDGEQRTLSRDEVAQMHRAGHVIAAHTHSHPNLMRLPFPQARSEILRSKEILEDITGAEVRHFAYPYGMQRHFSEELRDLCFGSGFATVANAVPCLLFAPQTARSLNRSLWRLDLPFQYNLDNLCVDGRAFTRLTGRGAAY